jgi:hypothetical protein
MMPIFVKRIYFSDQRTIFVREFIADEYSQLERTDEEVESKFLRAVDNNISLE